MIIAAARFICSPPRTSFARASEAALDRADQDRCSHGQGDIPTTAIVILRCLIRYRHDRT